MVATIKYDYATKIKTVRYFATNSSAAEKNVLKSRYGAIKDVNVTITQYIFGDSELWADKPAITCAASGSSYEYGMMKMLIKRCAKALLSELKLSPGDALGLILPNIPEFVVTAHGALEAGLVLTFVNPLYSLDEIRRQFSQCNVKAISTIEIFMPVAMEVSKSLKGYKGTIVVGGDGDKVKGIYVLRSLLMVNYKADLPSLDADNVCLIPYSSGTTGLPKGVMLTHRNLISSVKQLRRPEYMKNKGEKASGEVTLTVPPFFHIYGFNGCLNYSLAIGHHVISIPKFSPENYIEALIKYRPTTLFVVPSLLVFLSGHPAVKREHLETIETIIVGGAPATEGILKKFLKKSGKNKDELALLQGATIPQTDNGDSVWVLFLTPLFSSRVKCNLLNIFNFK